MIYVAKVGILSIIDKKKSENIMIIMRKRLPQYKLKKNKKGLLFLFITYQPYK